VSCSGEKQVRFDLETISWVLAGFKLSTFWLRVRHPLDGWNSLRTDHRIFEKNPENAFPSRVFR
jgi:hypothetical protein